MAFSNHISTVNKVQGAERFTADFLHTTGSVKFYRKFSKFLDTGKIGCNHSKIRTKRLNHSVMHLNSEDRMANSVDPDQTAPLGAV